MLENIFAPTVTGAVSVGRLGDGKTLYAQYQYRRTAQTAEEWRNDTHYQPGTLDRTSRHWCQSLVAACTFSPIRGRGVGLFSVAPQHKT